MKTNRLSRFSKFMAVGFVLAACTTLTPAQKTTIDDVEATALNAGVGYLTGGQAGAIAAAAPGAITTVQDAAYALRTLESPTGPGVVPSQSQVNSILTAVVQNPAVTKALGAPAAKVIAAAVKSGNPANDAIEAAASGLDGAAKVTPVVGASQANVDARKAIFAKHFVRGKIDATRLVAFHRDMDHMDHMDGSAPAL